jgi:hypothetical protein
VYRMLHARNRLTHGKEELKNPDVLAEPLEQQFCRSAQLATNFERLPEARLAVGHETLGHKTMRTGSLPISRAPCCPRGKGLPT